LTAENDSLPTVRKIVSGGQTGADRAALDWAIHHHIAHGGWCPQGRLAEDGTINLVYQLQETPSSDYRQRTEWNVRDSDGTVIFSLTEQLYGGSQLTASYAQQYEKPYLHLWPQKGLVPSHELANFVQIYQIRVLNVAGPRASTEPTIGFLVTDTLNKAFAPPK
jgi:hypothetical protein